MEIPLSLCYDGVTISARSNSAINPRNLLDLLECLKFKNWFRRATKNFVITKIDVQALTMFGSNIGFVYMITNAQKLKTHEKIPSVVFLRGDAVAVLPIITCEETDKRYIAVTSQARVPIGEENYLEIPAGMMDESDCFISKATEELEEEMHVTLDKKHLIPLGRQHPSPGGCDECVEFFAIEATLNKQEITHWLTVKGGLQGNGEIISVKLLLYDKQIHKRCMDMKLTTALYLYENQNQQP